jgi:hypothetical protein
VPQPSRHRVGVPELLPDALLAMFMRVGGGISSPRRPTSGMRTINRGFFAAAIISLVPLVMVPFARYHLPDLFAQLGQAGDAIVVVPPGGRVTGGGLSVFEGPQDRGHPGRRARDPHRRL